MDNKRVFVLLLSTIFFLAMMRTTHAITQQNFTVTINTPSANNTAISGSYSITVTVAAINGTDTYKNITEVFVKVRSFNGPILSILRNVTTNNLTSYTASWPTANGTFPDGLYTLIVDVSDGNATVALREAVNVSSANIKVNNDPLGGNNYNITSIVNNSVIGGNQGNRPNGNFTITVTMGANRTNITEVFIRVRQETSGNIYALNRTKVFENLSTFGALWSTANGTFPDGEYTLFVDILDANLSGQIRNTVNLSVGKITVDNTKPEVNLDMLNEDGQSATTFGFGETVKLRCSRRDITSKVNDTLQFAKQPSSSIFDLLQEVFTQVGNTFQDLDFDYQDTQILGDYVYRCRAVDQASNNNTVDVTFTIVEGVNNQGGGAAAVKGFSNPIAKVKVTQGSEEKAGTLTEEGISRLMQVSSAIIVNVKGEDHKITVKSLADDTVTVTIASTPFDVTVQKGETKTVDIDGDGENDMAITFHKRFPKGGKFADITYTLSKEPATPTNEPSTGSGAQNQPSGPEGTGATGASGSVWVVVIVIIVIVIIGSVLLKKKKK